MSNPELCEHGFAKGHRWAYHERFGSRVSCSRRFGSRITFWCTGPQRVGGGK